MADGCCQMHLLCFLLCFVLFLTTTDINTGYYSATACGDKVGLCLHLLVVQHSCIEQIPRSVHACTAGVV